MMGLAETETEVEDRYEEVPNGIQAEVQEADGTLDEEQCLQTPATITKWYMAVEGDHILETHEESNVMKAMEIDDGEISQADLSQKTQEEIQGSKIVHGNLVNDDLNMKACDLKRKSKEETLGGGNPCGKTEKKIEQCASPSEGHRDQKEEEPWR
jgi:hypothetical protein